MAGLFRDQIKAGDLLIGTLVTLASPEVTEIMVEIGFDWLFVTAQLQQIVVNVILKDNI
jgi:2-keto-3-deoxy-L-rhamnonate aldolase RhmA